MIRIQSSYSIIKKNSICQEDNKVSLIETKFEFIPEVEQIEETICDKEEEVEIDLDEIKEKIRKSLYLEMENERNQIINDARIEADKVKLESRKLGYKSGYQEGYKLGYKEAMDKAKIEGQIIKDNALKLIQESEVHVEEYIEENQKRIIELSVDMAESIVNQTIDSSSEDILMLIKPILQNYDKKDNIIITCHPNKYLYVKKHLGGLEDICPNARFVIMEDANLEENGCTIENEHQLVDLQIKNQIKSILEEVMNLE